MRLWRHAAEDAGILRDTRGTNHGCLWDAIRDALAVSDVHQVAQVIWQLFQKQADNRPIRIRKDAGMKDVWLDGPWLIADSQRRLHRVERDDR